MASIRDPLVVVVSAVVDKMAPEAVAEEVDHIPKAIGTL
jgi:hypothetical protein